MWLVVGLGNPGSQYRDNRHNLGFMVLDGLRDRSRAGTPRSKFGAEIAEGQIGSERVLFVKPMEFMNVSGQSVARAAQFWKVETTQTVVVYDDLDLPFARLKLGTGGGAGGHNGVRSLITELGSPAFVRVRFGIGRPGGGQDATAYVLANFSRSEQTDLPDQLITTANAVEAIITRGLPAAMNEFNKKKLSSAGS